MWIVFEGGDGCGKTTQIQLLCDKLKTKNIDFVFLREPGSTALGEKIRSLLLSDIDIETESEIMLFFAARFELLNKIIIPQLMQNKWVILDRFLDSTFAYQGYGKKGNLDLIETLSSFCLKKFSPNRIYILNANPKEALSRTSLSDRFERESLDFHARVQEGYLERALKGEGYRILDAALPPKTISQFIWEDILKNLDS